MRVFLDANILWSAAHHPGAVRLLLEKIAQAGHVRVVDGYVVEEAMRNLPTTRQATLARLLGAMELHPAQDGATTLHGHGLPDKDAPVLAAAIRLRCDYLITGDRRHFGHLMGSQVEGVHVLSPSDAVMLIPR